MPSNRALLVGQTEEHPARDSATSNLGKGKATGTVQLLFVSSLWYPEVQSRYSETKKYLHVVCTRESETET